MIAFVTALKEKERKNSASAWTTKVVFAFLFVLLLFPAGIYPLVLCFFLAAL